MTTLTGNAVENRSGLPGVPPAPLAILTGLLVLLCYSYFNSLSGLWLNYWNSDQYSHGYIVPVLAGVLLWLRWDPTLPTTMSHIATSARLWGGLLLALGLALRLAAAHMGMETPDMISFIPCLAGVLLMAGGWSLFRWVAPVVLFLCFMFPLPHRIEQAILMPLKDFATLCSYYLLQATGFEAYREGNIIFISGIPMGVVDACSGLRMLTVFLALCAAVAMIIQRPLWERIAIFLSAVPIAIAVNVLRITSTGMAYHFSGAESDWVHYIFHDNAGLMMMPLAMLLLYLEITLLGMFFLESDIEPSPATDTGSGAGFGHRNKPADGTDQANDSGQKT
jgi:exosortase